MVSAAAKFPVLSTLALVLGACGYLSTSDGNPAYGAESEKARTGADWPCFLGPTHNSRSPETGVLTAWPKSGPPVLWQLELGTGYGAPVVAGGRLYQFDRVAERARLRACDSRTGRVLWTFDYPSNFGDLYGYDNGPRCSPVVDGDRVYIFGAEGMLHCVDSATGKLRWKKDTAAEFGVVQNFFGVGSTPVIEGPLLIAMIGGSPREFQNAPPGALNVVVGNGSGVVAFDKLTGKVKYKLSDELASYASPLVATIENRRWCFVFARGGLLAFEPVSGKVDFHFPWRASLLESVNASTPVVVGKRVLISETYGPGACLLEVKPGGYRVVWSDESRRREKSMQAHWNTPVFHNGYIYGSSGRHESNAELRCVQFNTGKVMWSEPNLGRASLLYVDGHLICLSEDGTLRLIQATPEKYVLRAEVMLRATSKSNAAAAIGLEDQQLLKPPAWAAPVLSHGLLYVRGADRLVCLDLRAKR